MRRKQSGGIFMGFTDISLNMAGGFFLLLILVLTLVNVKKKKKDADIKIKSDILVAVTWPGWSKSDVDLYVQVPSNHISSFANKDVAGASLDRDDLGHRNDTIRLKGGGTKIIRENWENVFIRQIQPGEYTVNVHLYGQRDGGRSVPVKIRVERFSPYKLITQERVILKYSREEKTAVRFRVTDKNQIVDLHYTTKKLVGKSTRYSRDEQGQ